ncbi:hypothetical protein RI845_00310 [Thalassotalea nanhaiensis]|uniref:Uncharacterized protein n=1 Tax=Thalassotalea nanhaiensis TaxID=3065648 RepID=A0ABY9TIM5_9GAMM|nr:hypothetical protein RI845_00310 [Colwelliaceae bacterium SQ345]
MKLEQVDVSEEFKLIEAKFFRTMRTSALIALTIFPVYWLDISFINPWSGPIVAAILYNIWGYRYYRCPNCNSVITSAFTRKGFAFKPSKCIDCSAVFRK